MRGITSIFKPREQGLRKVLGDLEAKVMDIIWLKGQVSVRDVYREMLKDREIAYTTVMTTMARLAKKRLLVRKRKGMGYLYTPTISRDGFMDSVAGDVIDGLLDGFADSAMSQLLRRFGRDDPQMIEKLTEIIQEKRKKR